MGNSDEKEEIMEKCFFCKGTLEVKTVNFDFRWGESLVLFENVPALVCQQCGEKYFSNEVSHRMKEMAKSAIKKEIKVRELCVPVLSY